jgi:hypothetical protein
LREYEEEDISSYRVNERILEIEEWGTVLRFVENSLFKRLGEGMDE